MLANNSQHYGLMAIVLHWLAAITVIGLFALGLYMVELDYYSPWYHRAPHIHQSIGLLLFALMVFRLVMRCINPPPAPVSSLKRWEKVLSLLVHWLLYIVIFVVLISGYLISSAGGKAVAVFDWFSVPAIISEAEQQQDIAGLWHHRCAWLLIMLTVLHTLAALKHHFIDGDITLLRMLGIKR